MCDVRLFFIIDKNVKHNVFKGFPSLLYYFHNKITTLKNFKLKIYLTLEIWKLFSHTYINPTISMVNSRNVMFFSSVYHCGYGKKKNYT